MVDKFIPAKDVEFAHMTKWFAAEIGKQPQRWNVSEFDAGELVRRTSEFRDALAAALNGKTRNKHTIGVKDKKRIAAEEIVRRLSNAIRVDSRISSADKVVLTIRERPKKLKKRTVPLSAPTLTYAGSTRADGPNSTVHLLKYEAGFQIKCRSKPSGAVRIELFVDLVRHGEPIPQYPGQYLGGRPWYLRSFTSNPIRARFPVPPEPMLVVYWARWADAKGNVGPFSQTCITRTEGGYAGAGAIAGPDKGLGPMPIVTQLRNDPKQLTLINDLRELPQEGDRKLLPDNTKQSNPPPQPEGPQAEAA